MKKLFTILLMVLTVGVLSISSFAISRGTAYVEDNGRYDEKVTQATPGSTVYIALTEYSKSSKSVADTAKVTGAKTVGYIDDKDYKLIKTGKLDIVKRKVDSNDYWYFAELEIKDIDMDKYPEDGFEVEGTIKVVRKSGSKFTIDLSDSLNYIRFSEAEEEDELLKDAQLYTIDGGEDFELSFPNGYGCFSGTTRSKIEVLASMSHSEISAITKLDKYADMVFYIGNDAKFTNVRDGMLKIEADNGDYLYQIGSGNKLTNRTSTYDEDEDAFIIKTNVLGKYVVSDEKLSTNSHSRDDDDNDNNDNNDNNDVNVNKDESSSQASNTTYNYVPLINPSTGAVA